MRQCWKEIYQHINLPKNRVKNLITKIYILISTTGINKVIRYFDYLCSVSIAIFNRTCAISAEAWASYLWTTYAPYVICLAKKAFWVLSGSHKDIQVRSRQRVSYDSREVVLTGKDSNNYDKQYNMLRAINWQI